MPPLIRPLVTATFMMLGALAAAADPVTFQTATGPMTLPEKPQQIVALDVSAVDTLAALGHPPAGSVAPTYVSYLDPEATGAAPVGSFFDPDFEAIAALRPDLIIVGSRAASQADALSRIAPVADMSIGTDAFADGKARLAAYGVLLGREDAAQALSDALDARMADLRSQVQSVGGTALILMTNGPKLSVFGPASRFGWLHTELGFAPAVEGISDNRHGEAVSFEYIAQTNPDTMIVVDRGAAIGDGSAAAQATLDTPLVAGTAAAQEGRMIYLSPAELYIAPGGVQSMNRTLDEIEAALGAG
ncbi:siderophore ABC transporter substrate-binding protein [Pseudooceanicola sp. C21-150M6]|uniref:siderophore ABC transporter substrate-binding protein n=1 Tax=Pseudooceanicola sp. C21-150M6 TaxID=3434355 RepID=UPI003D7F9A2A